MFTLAIDMPNLPEGGTLVIDGLGEFVNGESTDISDEDAASYQARNTPIISEYDEEGKLHTSLGVGLTLAETFANHPFIKVTAKATSFVAAPKVVVPPLTDLTNS